MNRKKITALCIIGLFCGLLTLIGCAGTAKPGIEAFGGLGKGTDPVPFMEKVRQGTLPSGLSYFILENSKPENRAYLTLAVRAGSVLETDDEQGLAHFVEHMAFNGTARFPETELINYLRSLGMRFGPEVNAYTTYDETVFGIEVPVVSPEGVKGIPEKALAVLDDWTKAIVFNPKDVDDERPIIMEEYRSRLGAMERLRRQILPILFRGSPYAERSPIGLPEIIEKAPASALEGFYRKWYRADNMAIILVGDFDGAALEASLRDHFTIPAPGSPLNRPEYDLPPPQKNNLTAAVFTDPELTYTIVDLYYKRPPLPPRGDLAWYRQEIIDRLIDRMLDLRFQEEAMKGDAAYVGAGAGNMSFGKSSRYYVLMAQAKTGRAEETIRALLEEKESLVRYGFTGAEIDLAKGALLSDLDRMVQEKDRQESQSYVSGLVDFYLNGGNYAGIEWRRDAASRLLPLIRNEEIAAAVKDYFKTGDLTAFVMAPDSEQANLPDEARIKALVKEAARAKISPPDTGTVGSELLDRGPSPGKVLKESRDEETGALIWELDNGVRVILKDTKNRNDEIVLYAMARGGVTGAAEEDRVSAELAPEMLQISGLGPYSRTDLVKKLADKQVSFSQWTGSYYRGFQGSATSGDLKTLFEMIYLSFTDPRIDPAAVAVMMDQYRTNLALRDEDPDTVFSDEISRISSGGNPYFKALELSDLPRADMDRALDFIRRGLNPADYTFILTGNLDNETVRGLAETYLASLPRGTPWNTWRNLGLSRPGKTEKTLYKGKEDRGLVYMGWFAKEAYTEEGSITAQVLSEYLDIEMTEEIREKLGGVYSISVGASVSPVPEGELTLQVYFACDPKRSRELSAAVTELLNRTANRDIDMDNFAKAAEALKKEWEASMQNNGYIAQSYANSSVLLDQPLARLNRRPAYIDAVKPQDLQRLCRRALTDGPALVILYPEGWSD
jgi:zinc protease